MSSEPADRSARAIDSALFRREDVRQMLAELDIGALYRVLGAEAGMSQREVAARTGQCQSEVSEIVAGHRRVESHQVLVRIAERLEIPPEFMGLSWWGPDGTYCGEVTVAESPEGVDEDMYRRALIAATSIAALGQALHGLGELTELALPVGQPLPSQLGMAHVHTVEAVVGQLRGMTRHFGGQAGLFGNAAKYYTRWMQVPAPDDLKARLGAALAELYTEAGWACYDAGMNGLGWFARAVGLADEARDGFGISNAAWHSGVTLMQTGHPDEALKCFQLGQLVLTGFQPGKARPPIVRTDDTRVPILAGRLNRSSAVAYSLLGNAGQAQRCLAQAQDGWAPREAFEQGGAEVATARTQLELGRLDAAEPFATSAVRTYSCSYRGRTVAELLLANLHLRTGEPNGVVLAQQAIKMVSSLQSVAVRRDWLVPLAATLKTRPGNDTKELARLAHQIVATTNTAYERRN